jgi:hypothetical protein
MAIKIHKASDNTIGYFRASIKGIQQNAIARIGNITLPSHFDRFIGVTFTASVDGLISRSYQLGILTIHFNNSKSYSHFPVHSIPISNDQCKIELFSLDEYVVPGSPIIMEYKETSGLPIVNFPYDVNIIFKMSIKRILL